MMDNPYNFGNLYNNYQNFGSFHQLNMLKINFPKSYKL